MVCFCSVVGILSSLARQLQTAPQQFVIDLSPHRGANVLTFTTSSAADHGHVSDRKLQPSSVAF
jgi:hypothetical protein